MKNTAAPKVAKKPVVNASRDTISEGFESLAKKPGASSCLCCQSDFGQIRQKQKFCSSRCRLLYWAAGEIVKERMAGRVNGLKGLIKELEKIELEK